MALVQRQLEIAIKLATNTQTNQPQTFSESGLNTLTLKGHRASLRIANSGASAGYLANLDIWGLTPSLINQLATLGMISRAIPNNIITITAGDSVAGMSTVYVGNILTAAADFSAMPDVPLRMELQSGAADAVIPFPASSFTGGTDVAVVLSKIATQAGWGFENNGVSAILSSPYFYGSAVQQANKAIEAAIPRIRAAWIAGAGRSTDEDKKGVILAIWPYYGSRQNTGLPLIGPDPIGQMIGYPTWDATGVVVRTLFDPRLTMGGQFQLKTSDPSIAQPTVNSKLKLPVDGVWNIWKLDLALDTLVPRGKWESIVYGNNPFTATPVPQMAPPS